jgi:hypothetical protein
MTAVPYLHVFPIRPPEKRVQAGSEAQLLGFGHEALDQGWAIDVAKRRALVRHVHVAKRARAC